MEKNEKSFSSHDVNNHAQMLSKRGPILTEMIEKSFILEVFYDSFDKFKSSF